MILSLAFRNIESLVGRLVLLDVYGHYLPTESTGFADALTAPNGTQTALNATQIKAPKRAARVSPRNRREKMEPTIRLERTTCSLREGSDDEENQ